MHASTVLLHIALGIVTATLLAVIAKALRQPVILGYIAAGVLIGPIQGIGWIEAESLEPIAELGLILLLFMIGLEIDLRKLRRAGAAVVAVGVLQFPACVGIGMLLFAPLVSASAYRYSTLYLAVAAALSSTMIVVKLLYDRGALDSLTGRITIGTLVFQDLWAILFLALQPNLDEPRLSVIAGSLAKAALLVAFAFLVSRYILPRIFRFIAKVPELLLIGSLAWCFLVAIVAQQMGLSLEMGALIAGVAVSTFPYNLDVIAKVVSLRDFFITLFFVALGSRIVRPTLPVLFAALVGAGIVLLTRLLTMTPVLYGMRRGNRASIIPALNLAQVSEFSLVIGAIGLSLAHIGEQVLAIIVYMMVITAVGSTYLIQFSDRIFAAVNPVLERVGLRERLRAGDSSADEEVIRRPITFLGFFRDASSILHELVLLRPAAASEILVVDFNPDVIDELRRRGVEATYGDIAHLDTLAHAAIDESAVIVCSLPDDVLRGTTNLRLLRKLHLVAPGARTIMTSERFDLAEQLYEAGASFVYVPRIHSARDVARVIVESMQGDPHAHRRQGIAELKDRTEVIV
jgi:Kef-type K+ transport system membrane component KefB